MPAVFKRQKKSHQEALRQVREHFEKMTTNYANAAKRVGEALVVKSSTTKKATKKATKTRLKR